MKRYIEDVLESKETYTEMRKVFFLIFVDLDVLNYNALPVFTRFKNLEHRNDFKYNALLAGGHISKSKSFF